MRNIGYGAAPGGGHLASLLDPHPNLPPFRGRERTALAASAISNNHASVNDARHLTRRRCITAALRAHDAVDDRHADAGQIAELNAVEDGVAGRMLRLVHD